VKRCTLFYQEKKKRGKKEDRKLLLFVPVGFVHGLSLRGKVCGDFLPQTYFPEAPEYGRGWSGNTAFYYLYLYTFYLFIIYT